MSEPQATRGPELARWTRSLQRSAMEEMLVATARPGILSLALGLPAPDLFPTAALGRALEEVLAQDPRALQYGPPREDLRAFVAHLMRRRGVICEAEQIFLTTGAQQAMSLVARLLLDSAPSPAGPARDEGPVVVLEEQCYPGFQQVLAAHQPQILTVATTAGHGIDLDALEHHLRAGVRPSLLYTMSDAHNPLGCSLPRSARERLVALARRYGVTVLEDDAYGMISYDGCEGEMPALRALDDTWVIYVGSFSKTLAPALRTGWIVVPQRFLGPLGSLKEASDINTATLGQRAVASLVASGSFDAHLQHLRTNYALRRDAMLEALQEALPSQARWTAPRAGFFVWVEIEGVDTVRLLEHALEHQNLAFLPGAAFTAGDAAAATHALRLSFSYGSPEMIRDGVQRLGRAVAAMPSASAARATPGDSSTQPPNSRTPRPS